MEQKQKSIIVVGGGISGLSVLHFLCKKYAGRSDVSIKLLEKNNDLGGTVKTLTHSLATFECGPNGFLDSREATMRLVKDLGLESELISASLESNKRFLFTKNKLHALPTDFLSFLRFKPLSFWDKLRVPFEIFVKAGQNPDESVYEFGARRLGQKFAKIFLDPMVSGIFAGDLKKLHLKSVFPKMFDLEQKHGSLLKAAFKRGAERKNERNPNSAQKSTVPFTASRLVSFKQGMTTLIGKLKALHGDAILLDQDVQMIVSKENRFVVHANQRVWDADEIFVCVPAYQAAQILKPLNESLSTQLNKIYYAPVAVVGLLFEKNQISPIPRGFGYLIPTWENRTVLGVVFDNQIYPNRAAQDHELFRVMIGGACFPEIIRKSEEDLIELARQELHASLSIKLCQQPVHSFVVVWPKGIPQYLIEHIPTRETISWEVNKTRNLHIVSNYIGGVSLNDCVSNAETAVAASKI